VRTAGAPAGSGAAAASADSGAAWGLPALAVRNPWAAFAALRDDSDEAAMRRSEPVLALLLLAGIAAVLASATAGHLKENPAYDALLIAVWMFLGGGLYGTAAYWLFGASVWAGLRVFGSEGSYRRARHVLALAAVPVALSLVLWVPKLALYGSDLFARGGADSGAGGAVFAVLWLAFLAWGAALLVVGVRTVEGWPWGRTLAAVATAAAIPVAARLLLSAL
jgi:hypothetical protein